MNDSWMQILTVVLANFTVVWWFRKESREDWVRMDKEAKENWSRRDREMKEFRELIRLDMKDFHERLLKIEMERKK